MSGGAVSAKADPVCRQKEVLIFDHCLNGKKPHPNPKSCVLFLKNSVLYYHGNS